MLSVYPDSPGERDQWILARRPAEDEAARSGFDVERPQAFFLEDECGPDGTVVPVATVFLTNRECPWRCLMCDLWRHTVRESVPAGAIPTQIDYALERISSGRHIKLYNSGSFFDPRAIPVEDYSAIAERVKAYERVIVECHPALIGANALRFRDLLASQVEVAMGLETVHPEILPRLNKRMTLPQFGSAARFLREHQIDLRVFILVKPPFMAESDAVEWAERSIDFAFDCGATAVTLIPTRSGNGAMNELASTSDFAPPRLPKLEEAFQYGLGLRRGRVFVDLWDTKRGESCATCFENRVQRLRSMNLRQTILPAVACTTCQ